MTSAMHEPILEYPEESHTDPGPQRKRSGHAYVSTSIVF